MKKTIDRFEIFDTYQNALGKFPDEESDLGTCVPVKRVRMGIMVAKLSSSQRYRMIFLAHLFRKTPMKTDLLDIRHCDCMDLMREFPDKHFDLAIVDPPYGINIGKGLGKWMRARGVKESEWDESTPDASYFNELFRVSNNQIIWGGNYFCLPPSRHFCIWNKGAGFKDRSYAECEFAWGSFDENARVLNRDPLACGDYDGKIHPTQKPVALYRWLLANYAKAGDKILDTHCGSGSIAIACHYAGNHLTACELDADYYKAACERIDRETRQQTLFTETPSQTTTQTELI